MSPLLRRLLLAALLQLAPAQVRAARQRARQPAVPSLKVGGSKEATRGLGWGDLRGPALDAGFSGARRVHPLGVVSWIDVYTRATCQPREVVVPLTVELMGTVAKQLVPSCVTVQRCGGCCPDDGLECVPTGQHQVRMQILMIRYPSSQLGEMSLEEHSQCECSPRTLCPRCTQRHQRPDPRTCRCRCRRRSFLRCQGRGLELNPDTCRFSCLSTTGSLLQLTDVWWLLGRLKISLVGKQAQPDHSSHESQPSCTGRGDPVGWVSSSPCYTPVLDDKFHQAHSRPVIQT
ncbi:hypothetical protein H8959_003095 [Pygathrix nigripes]